MPTEPELPWTGERLVPSHLGDTAVEHLHRYALAREFAAGRDVLDIACGEGYGSALLAQVARSVVGVDIDAEAVAHAGRKYGEPGRVRFEVGTCTAMPLPDASVDLVVSFETLEHLVEHEEMMAEVRRVLRPGGMLVLSTPDRLHCTIEPQNFNPYHFRELFRDEFLALLGGFFRHVRLLHQRIYHGSLMVPAAHEPIQGFRHYQGDFAQLDHEPSLVAPLFNLAVATDSDEALTLHASLFVGRGIPTDVEKRLDEAQGLNVALQAAEAGLLAAEASYFAAEASRLSDAAAHRAVLTAHGRELARFGDAIAGRVGRTLRIDPPAARAGSPPTPQAELERGRDRLMHVADAVIEELGCEIDNLRAELTLLQRSRAWRLADWVRRHRPHRRPRRRLAAAPPAARPAAAPAPVAIASAESSEPPTRVALGIVSYHNEPAQLDRLLRSVDAAAAPLRSGGRDAAVYTIDCGDGASWPEGASTAVHQLEPLGNLGFGGGMNALMDRAFADPAVGWFLCVNPDGLLHHGLLAELLARSDDHPGDLIEARQFPEEHPKPYDPATGETLWASGACLLIPRSAYRVLGGFDPNIFMYMEDVDISWRARAHGMRIRVAPRALFGHSVLDRTPNATIDKFYYDSARYLAAKWGHPAEQAQYEQVLRDRGYHGGHVLPPLPHVDPRFGVPDGGRAVADFTYGFVYSPRRW